MNGREERDLALAQVETNAHQEWMEMAVQCMYGLAASGAEFTSDTVRDAVPEEFATHEPRALGPVMMRGIRDGVITAVGWTTEGRAAAHARPRRLYIGTEFVNKEKESA